MIKVERWDEFTHDHLVQKHIDKNGIGWMSCKCGYRGKMQCLSPKRFLDHVLTHVSDKELESGAQRSLTVFFGAITPGKIKQAKEKQKFKRHLLARQGHLEGTAAG